MPAGACLISPWVDLTHSMKSIMGPDGGDYVRRDTTQPVRVELSLTFSSRPLRSLRKASTTLLPLDGLLSRERASR